MKQEDDLDTQLAELQREIGKVEEIDYDMATSSEEDGDLDHKNRIG